MRKINDLPLYVFGAFVVALFIVSGFTGYLFKFFYAGLFCFASTVFAGFYFAFREQDYDKWSFVLDVVIFATMIPIGFTAITTFEKLAVDIIVAIFYVLYSAGFLFKAAKSIKAIKSAKLVKQGE